MSDLKPGYRWGRHWYHKDSVKIWTEWAILEIWASSPFLRAEVRYVPNSSINTEDPFLSIENHLDKWEFGPELNIPNKDTKE